METNLLQSKDCDLIDKTYKKHFTENYGHLNDEDSPKSKTKKSPLNWNIINLKKSEGRLGTRNTEKSNYCWKTCLGIIN